MAKRQTKKASRKGRLSAEEVVKYYESLKDEDPNERVEKTAKHFGRKAQQIKLHLKHWWPGPQYQKVFGRSAALKGKRTSQIFTTNPRTILKTLNSEGSIVRAAAKLDTSPMTLRARMEELGIVQEWVMKKE